MVKVSRKSKTSSMLPLFIQDKYHWNVLISNFTGSFPSLSCFCSFMNISTSSWLAQHQLVRNLPMYLHLFLKMVIEFTLWVFITAHRLQSTIIIFNVNETNVAKLWITLTFGCFRFLIYMIHNRPLGITEIIVWLCLTSTGNYQIHEFDWLKSIL